MRRTSRALVILMALLIAQLPALRVATAAHGHEVAIDIKPGDGSGAINMRADDLKPRDGGVIPVAILSSPSFDAATIDASTVCFGDPNNGAQRDCTEVHGRGHLEDVDRDGDTDLLLHYEAAQTGFDDGDTQGCLEGATAGGTSIFGCESIEILHGVAEAHPPNLVAAIEADPSSASANDAVQWTATVTNSGAGATTLAPGTALISLDAPATLISPIATGPAGYTCAEESGPIVCRVTHPDTIGVGGARTFLLDAVLPVEPGPVTVSMVADPEHDVAESVELDNTAEAAAVVEASNLTVTLVADPPALAPGDDVTWTARLRNDGTGAARFPAGSTQLRFSLPPGLSNTAATGPTGYSCVSVASDVYECRASSVTTIAAGAEVIFTLSALAPADVGAPELAVMADPDDVITEGTETDNEATSTILVQDPNLIVALVSSPSEPNAGDPIEWTATVTNVGPTRVRVASGMTLVGVSMVPAIGDAAMTAPTGYSCSPTSASGFSCVALASDILAVGDSRVFQMTATAPTGGGSIDVTALVDPSDLVREASESDNSITRSTAVVVSLPDLSISLSGSPDPVDAVATSTWVARITNEAGRAIDLPSGLQVIRLQVPTNMANLAVSTPAGYTCFLEGTGVVGCTTTTATSIAAGAHVDITLFGTAPRQPGPLAVTAIADPLGAIPEGDETDNEATATITVQAPDFSITLTGSPDPVDAAATSTWVARITNDGPSNARITNGMQVIRLQVPTNMSNLAVSTPAGYTCFLEGTGVVGCTTTATTNLAAGAHVDITLFGTAPRQPGPLAVTAIADPLGAIPEGDETDNEATATITVQAPDFSITLTGTPDPVAPSGNTTWVATITNDGPSNARITSGTQVIRFAVPPELTSLTVSTPAGYTCFLEGTGVVGCTTTATTNLAAGASLEFTLFGRVGATPGPRSVEVRATADPLEVIPEGDETDNSATARVNVS